MFAVLLLGAIAGGIFAVRAGVFHPFASDGFVEQMCKAAQARFDQLEVTPVADRDDLLQRLAGAERGQGPALTERQREALVVYVADFILLRLIERDRARYIEWRLAHGDTPLPLDSLLDQGGVRRGHQTYFGTDLVPGQDFDALFARFWDGAWEYGDGFNQFRALSTGAPGVHVVTGFASASRPGGTLLEGELGKEVWHGAIAHGFRSWFEPAITLRSELKEKKRSLMAEVGLIAEYERGPRRPLMIRFVWSERLQRWSLISVNTNNVNDQRISALEY